MTYNPKGKHVTVDPSSPDALGICDYTGFVHKRSDLVKQMEWRGNAIVWTGFYVGRDYVDVPNEQLRPPILPPDPVPVQQPRLPQSSNMAFGSMSFPEHPIVGWGNIPVFDFVAWSGSSNGVICLPINERRAALQNFNWGAG